MKVLILSVCTKEHAYLIGKVLEAFPNAAVVKIGGPEPRATPVDKRPDRGRRAPLRLLFKEAVVDWIGNIRRHAMERKLFPSGAGSSLPVSLRVRDPNSPDALAAMRALQPEVVVVFGAPILKAGALSLGAQATVNVHLGIPPKYRGNNTIFWALKQRDFDHVGACLHHLAPAVDAGNVLVEVFPALSRRSNDLDAMAGSIRLIAKATVDLLRFVERRGDCPPGIPQVGEHHNYKGSDRTMGAVLAYVLRRTLPGARPKPREDRVVLHY